MIYILGDTHGEIDHHKLNTNKIFKNCNNHYPDYVIILGDFGFIWYNDSNNKTEQYWLNWIETKPWITLFIDGNHENFSRLNNFPNVYRWGNTVGQISDKIYHLKRGNIYTIENKNFFCLGGAESTDKLYRQAYINWWPEEVPSYKEYYNALENLEKYNFSIDYVLTHTAPKHILQKYYDDRYNDPTALMLEEIYKKITYKKWYHGHMHEDIIYNEKDIDIIGVYEKNYIIF